MKEAGGSFDSALGPWELRWTPRGVSYLRPGSAASGLPEGIPDWVAEAVEALKAHFEGRPRELRRLPVDLEALPPFRLRVALALRDTAPGQPLTYGTLALLAGRPGAARAAGQAVKRNPVLVLVPCHRVVAASGPGGWSAFGHPDLKARLLALEAPGGREPTLER